VVIRISSIEPEETSQDVLGLFAHPRVAPHLHLPLQSGSDRVLREMNRPYTVRTFVRIVEAARGIRPGIAIGNDVIVGYPTETERDFEQTRALIEEIAPAYLHVFRYSPRPGTPAFGLGDPVPYQVKQARSGALTGLSKALRTRFIEGTVGGVLRVVYLRDRDGGWKEGLADNYVKVLYQGDSTGIATVEIRSRDGDFAKGKEV